MNPGQLSHRITIQSPSASVDAIGQPLTTWTDVASLWANIKHQSGISAIKSGADTSIVSCSIRIRHRPAINAGMRVLHGVEIFNIQAILPDGKNKYTDLVCEATNADV